MMQRVLFVSIAAHASLLSSVCAYSTGSFRWSRALKGLSLDARPPEPFTSDEPKAMSSTPFKNIPKVLAAGLFLGTVFGRRDSASAIGELYEFKNQSMVLQDIGFNVIETDSEASMFEKTFESTCFVLRSSRKNGENVTVLGFGPDNYRKSSSFLPGKFCYYWLHEVIDVFYQEYRHLLNMVAMLPCRCIHSKLMKTLWRAMREASGCA